ASGIRGTKKRPRGTRISGALPYAEDGKARRGGGLSSTSRGRQTAGSLGSRLLLGRLPDELDVDLDVDVLTDHHSTGFQHLVPGQAEVLAVDPGGRRRAAADVAPGVLDLLVETLDLQGDLLGHAADRQVTDHLQLALAQDLGLLRLEGQGRVLRHVEKVRAAQMLVAL